eukprot:6467637-Ditylum_brightwellii.AAC.1
MRGKVKRSFEQNKDEQQIVLKKSNPSDPLKAVDGKLEQDGREKHKTKTKQQTLLGRLKDVESEVFGQSGEDSYDDLRSRLEKVQCALDSEKKSFSSAAVKMSQLEEDIVELTSRIDDAQDKMYGQKRPAELKDKLSDKLSGLEEILGLVQKDKPLLSRMDCIEKNIVMRIDKLEDRIFKLRRPRKSNESLTDRLGNLGRAVGVNPTSPVLFQ